MRALVPGIVLLASTALLAPSAVARGVTVSDATTAGRVLDITSVTYKNKPYRAAATVHLRNPNRTGSVTLRIAPVDSDVDYALRVRRLADGSLRKDLMLEQEGPALHKRCSGMSASWSTETGDVNVGLPQSCLRWGRYLVRTWFWARTHNASGNDGSAMRKVGRGDSPGCANRNEMGQVHRGQTRGHVAIVLDTPGRFGAGFAGGYSRVYSNCGGGRGWYVDYNGDTARVIAKGRVG